jgi:hypothetical protein
MPVEIDLLIQRLQEVAPHACIGRGPEHPTHPDLTLANRLATWLEVHPFLNQDAGYVDFLRRYSGVDVLREYTAENVAKGLDWDLKIPGFAPGPGPLGWQDCLDYTGGHGGRLDPTALHGNESGFYHFATICFRASGEGNEPSDWAQEEFGFDASAQRRAGVYRILDTPEWFCESFSEWLVRVIDGRGRIFSPQHLLSDLLAPQESRSESNSHPSRLALAALYSGAVGLASTLLCVGIIGVPLGIFGAILAGVALVRRKKGDSGPAVAGMILGILAVALVPVVGLIVTGNPWPFK